VSFNFLCSAVEKFHFGRAILGEQGFAPQRTPNLVQTIVLQTTSNMSFNFLCWAFQKFTLGRSFFWGRGGGGGLLPPEEPQIWSRGRLQTLVQTIVSQTTSYIVSFNFLCSAVQKFHFESPRRTHKFGQSNKNIKV